MKIIYYLFMSMLSWSLYAQEGGAVPSAVNIALQLEELATHAESCFEQQSSGIETFDQKYMIRNCLYEQYEKRFGEIISEEQNPRTLYLLIIILYEGYDPHETLHDRLLFSARCLAEITLAKLGTEEAYRYFMRLKNLYGRDGAGSASYKTLEYRYLKRYSEDPEILNSPHGVFI